MNLIEVEKEEKEKEEKEKEEKKEEEFICIKSLCKDKLENLLNIYEENEYIKNKLINHILNQLPILLDQANINYKRREERKLRLESDQYEFTNRFLNIKNYFYINNTEIFFNYDNKHYKTYKEDDILHEVLSTITHEQNLMPWKHKIKLNILKLIKECSLLKSIPEYYTIEYVLNNIYPSIFSTKNKSKYFLTIIGDNILRKNDNLIYLIDNTAKNFIKIIASSVYNYFGNSSIAYNFKYKYHEQHKYEDCRLIHFNPDIQIIKNNFFSTEFNKNILDLLCVAVHYSNIYNSADDFLLQSDDNDLITYSYYLKNNTPKIIIDEFINKSLQKSCQEEFTSQINKINTKKMLYLWKLFLKDNNFPHIIFLNTLKNILKDKLTYSEESDTFLNITSVQLPLISNFTNFWDENMRENEEDIQLEIEEITILFKYWITKNQLKNFISIKENFILDLIKHFYSDIIIDDDKYILHIKCILWNKDEDINNFLQEYKLHCSKKEKYSLSLNNLYTNYCKATKKNICTASKYYFEKYINEHMKEYINNDKMILPSWWQEISL